jgi:hypothetical protein
VPRQLLILLSCLAAQLLSAMLFPENTCAKRLPPHRTFLMGTSRWPPDLTAEAIQTVDSFLSRHADLVSIHLDNGVPWEEAAKNRPFPPKMQHDLDYKRPANHKLFVSITPMNVERNDLAPSCDAAGGFLALDWWRNKSFNSSEVKQSYLNFARRVVKTMHPDYLAIGIEVNVLLSKNPAKWPQFIDLERSTYYALKKEYPSLPIFVTLDTLHLLGMADKADSNQQKVAARAILNTSDILALSVYPFMNPTLMRPCPNNFLDFALSYGKPIAVSESGYSSKQVSYNGIDLAGSDENQCRWISYLLTQAQLHAYVFVINYASTDYERLVNKLPNSVRELARIWSYTGLQDENFSPKKALGIWDMYLTM